MYKIARHEPDILVISDGTLQAFVRLCIWLAVVATFYAVILGGGGPSMAGGRDLHDWLLLLFPLFLLPYLINCIRTISGAGALVVDGTARTLWRRKRPLARFADIREIELRPVNATCEEFCLSASLSDGRRVTLVEGKRLENLDDLAREIAEMTGVRLSRAT